jgi:hypothetical protein
MIHLLFRFQFRFMVFNVISTIFPWSYGSLISNYLCNQCLSQLMLWVRTPLRRGVLDTTLCDKVCQGLVTGQWLFRFQFRFMVFNVISTIFQLYCGGQFFLWGEPEDPGKNTDPPPLPDKMPHLMLYLLHLPISGVLNQILELYTCIS